MLVVRGQGLIEALRGETELQTGGAGPLDAFVVAAEVNTVGPERDRCFAQRSRKGRPSSTS